MVSRPTPSPYDVATFRDAIGLSLELSCYHRQARFALLSDHDHQAVHLLAHLDDQGPPRSMAVDLAADEPQRWGRTADEGGSLLVISIDEADQLGFDPVERAAYFSCRAELARHRLTLRDWMRTDGDRFVSAAYAWHPATAWPDDLPSIRRADRAMVAAEARPKVPKGHSYLDKLSAPMFAMCIISRCLGAVYGAGATGGTQFPLVD